MPENNLRSIWKTGFVGTVAVAVVIGAMWVLYMTRYIVLVALIGIGLGALMAPLMRYLERHRIPRAISAILFVVLLFGGALGVFFGIASLVHDQALMLAERAPDLIERVRAQMSTLLVKQPWLAQQIDHMELEQTAQSTLRTVFSGLQASASALGAGLLILVLAIYTAVNARDYLLGFLSLFPRYLRPQVRDVVVASIKALRIWFSSQLIVMSITATITSFGLWFFGIDYWLFLGILTGALGFIPYIGAFLTGFLTILVTLGSQPEKVWWVLALYLGIQQLEGHVTIPLVMRGRVQLPEVTMIVMMLVMGSLFGLLGIFVTPPFFAMLRTIYLMTYAKWMDRQDVPPSVPPKRPRNVATSEVFLN